MSNELRRVPLHTSLTRPDLLFGCERPLVLVAGLICLLFGAAITTKWSVILAILTWLGAVAALRIMAKADPLMSKVYLRHIKYQKYYPALPTVNARSARHARK